MISYNFWNDIVIYISITLVIFFLIIGMISGGIAFSKPLTDIESRKRGIIKSALFVGLAIIAGFIALSVYNPGNIRSNIYFSSCLLFFVFISFGVRYFQLLFISKKVLSKWRKFLEGKNDKG